MKRLLLLSAQILMLSALSPGLANALEKVLISTAASGWLEQKTIKDQAEYNDYITALNMTDSAAKAAAMEHLPANIPRVSCAWKPWSRPWLPIRMRRTYRK
jgi:hypothetical protein